MGSFSITHWLILLVVVVVVFGTAKLKNAGKDLGGAVKGFKEAVKDENTEPKNAWCLTMMARPIPTSAQQPLRLMTSIMYSI